MSASDKPCWDAPRDTVALEVNVIPDLVPAGEERPRPAIVLRAKDASGHKPWTLGMAFETSAGANAVAQGLLDAMVEVRKIARELEAQGK